MSPSAANSPHRTDTGTAFHVNVVTRRHLCRRRRLDENGADVTGNVDIALGPSVPNRKSIFVEINVVQEEVDAT